MQPTKVQYVPLKEWLNLSQHLADLYTISMSAGPGNELFILAAPSPIDYREEAHGASFAKINPDQPEDFVILRIGETNISRHDIFKQQWNYHYVQPLPNDEMLLVCARSRYRTHDDYDLNAKVFSLDGELQREFLLGDGIRDVQVTSSGQIWVGYSDEGVFGNFGWNKPVGSSGLIQWDKFGKKTYQFSPPAGLRSICDCYVLNVVSNTETWCYYYDEFALVQIRDGQSKDHWACPISGSSGFLIWRDFVLFQGGYDDHDLYHLAQLDNGNQMRSLATYRFTDEKGNSLKSRQIETRGCFLYVLEEDVCYRLDLRELVNRPNK
jgi:hypothetical protein